MRRFSPAAPTDEPAVLALYEEAKGAKDCTWNEYYPTAEDCEIDLSHRNLFVLREEDEIIAAVSVVSEPELDGLSCWRLNAAKPAEIARVVVKKAFRHRGVGKELLRSLFEELKRRDYDAVHLCVALINPSAQAMYRSLGFSFVGTVALYGNDYKTAELSLKSEENSR